MKIVQIKYEDVQVKDKIFTNGKDNHMFRKLKFNEIEVVKEIKKYLSKGNGQLVQVEFESGNKSLGFPDRFLSKILE